MLKYGFMSSSLASLKADVAKLEGTAQFIELQVPDRLYKNFDAVRQAALPESFDGYFTIHGEGENDGKKRIKFSSSNDGDRREYVYECASLYSAVTDHFPKVERLVLHPDAINAREPRAEQISRLAMSLVEIQDNLPQVQVCIEPRGGDNQRKVLRAHTEDIIALEEHLSSLGGASRVGLCMDVAQMVIVHGQPGARRILEHLRSEIRLPVQEFHISDVALSQNRVAVEVGKGRVDWSLLLPAAVGNCANFLIETLGGTKVFKRSKEYLESLARKNEVLL